MTEPTPPTTPILSPRIVITIDAFANRLDVRVDCGGGSALTPLAVARIVLGAMIALLDSALEQESQSLPRIVGVKALPPPDGRKP